MVGEAYADELAKCFETFEVMIRKDLEMIENNSLLLFRYIDTITTPQELVSQAFQSVSIYKENIARMAVGLIKEPAMHHR